MALYDHNKRIGLLGGSFNPAHEGHVYISCKALKILGLDEVWWLVSPQNPLKEKEGMAPFAERLEGARKVAACCSEIIISDFEINSKTTHTYNTVCAIKFAYPQHNFVWLMGADNMLQFPQWHRWKDIAKVIPIAVFNRGKFKEKSLAGEFAKSFAHKKESNPAQIFNTPSPVWTFIDIAVHPGSATNLRNGVFEK
jgi:nicotinate-nucleotide adenylyltransferase